MGKGASGAGGFYYNFGIHMGISRGPINELVEIRVGDKTAWEGNQTESGEFIINSPELFGGDKQEGGIVGGFDLLMGLPAQTAPPRLVGMLGHALPGFRGMVTAFFEGRISANSPYPKPWKFRVRRTTKGWENDEPWYPEKAKIVLGQPFPAPPPAGHYDHTTQTYEPYDGPPLPDVIKEIHAMNPAHILYECLTNRQWGRGLPASALNIASFAACADTLFEEEFGLCLRWSRRDNLQSFMQSVIDHISAALYSDRATSLLTLKLIRSDYVAENLPIYDTDSGLLQINEAVVSSLGPAINEIVVTYTDQLRNLEATVSAQNLASLQSTRGVFNSLKKSYTGVPTPALALRLAQRDLRANAMALRRFKLTFDRRAWKIPPAGVIRIRDLQRGIQDIVVRVGRIEDGTLTNGQITITAVQDVFAFPKTSFIDNTPPTWIGPNTLPEIRRHRIFELPYFLLNRNLSAADFAMLGPDVGFVGSVVEKPTPLSAAYDLYIKSGVSEPNEIP